MSWHRCRGLAAGVVFAVAASLHAQATAGLDDKVLAGNRELDRQLLEAHTLKDAAMLQSLFSESPDVFFISPGGSLNRGRDAVRGRVSDLVEKC